MSTATTTRRWDVRRLRIVVEDEARRLDRLAERAFAEAVEHAERAALLRSWANGYGAELSVTTASDERELPLSLVARNLGLPTSTVSQWARDGLVTATKRGRLHFVTVSERDRIERAHAQAKRDTHGIKRPRALARRTSELLTRQLV